jgi:hypothetical protein
VLPVLSRRLPFYRSCVQIERECCKVAKFVVGEGQFSALLVLKSRDRQVGVFKF